MRARRRQSQGTRRSCPCPASAEQHPPDGLSNQAIGARLHLTEGTVKSHLARIYAKLDVDSRTAVVATATDLGLIRR